MGDSWNWYIAGCIIYKLAANDKRVTRFRTSKPKDKNGIRLVLELSQDFQLTVFPLPPAGQYGERLVVDLYDKEIVQLFKKENIFTY